MRYIAIDFETTGLNYYSPDFRVLSIAMSWLNDEGELKNIFVEGYSNIYAALRILQTKDTQWVVHNLTFELGVLTSWFPDIAFPRMWDTMRLCQVGDAGEFQKKYESRYQGIPRDGLSLENCCSRWLPADRHHHKQTAHNFLIENRGIDPKDCGKNIHLLPPQQLREYNVADTDNTLLLFNSLIKQFDREGYKGWELDHQLYRGRCQQLVRAFIHGVKVDAEKVSGCVQKMSGKLVEMVDKFTEINKTAILSVVKIKQQAYIDDPTIKTERGRQLRVTNIETKAEFSDSDKINGFSITSPKDLLLLFSSVMGITPPFYTKPDKSGNGGGNPSFAKAHMKAWHPSGEILENRGTYGIVKKQAENLGQLSAGDGRWHLEMRATGTKTGRLSGGRD